jgi:hypothetical protein
MLPTAGLFSPSSNYVWYSIAVLPRIALGNGAPTSAPAWVSLGQPGPAWAMTLASFLLYRPSTLHGSDLARKPLVNHPTVIAAVSAPKRGGTLTQGHGASRWKS